MNYRPSRVGVIPCLLILCLWLLLPPPNLPNDPQMDAETREAALRALKASQAQQHRFTKLRIDHTQRVKEAIAEVSGGSAAGGVNADSAASAATAEPCDDHHSKPRVLLVTGVSPSPCKAPAGDHITSLSIKNKQDYARLHGYDFYVSNQQVDKNLTGAWNKVALVRDLLHDHREYEWIMWIDYDALIVDMKFQLPLERYVGFDFVLWGQKKELFELGDAHMGLNTGVFLIRNTDWARSLFTEVGKYGVENGKLYEKEMEAGLSHYDWALFDQNGFAYVLKHWQPERSIDVVFLEGSYTLNGYWKDWPTQKMKGPKKPFIKHYMGCQFCSGINKMDGDKCRKEFLDDWQLVDWYGRLAWRDQTSHDADA